MTPNSDKADVESRLHRTAEAMSNRLASIQEEVSTSGNAVRNWIVQNPVKSVGGMLATGLVLGGLLGGSKSRRRKRHADLVDTYLDALRNEVNTAVDDGDEPGPAVEKALRDRVPLGGRSRESARETETSGSVRTLIRQGAGILFSTGLSLLAREVIESVLANFDVEAIVEEELLE